MVQVWILESARAPGCDEEFIFLSFFSCIYISYFRHFHPWKGRAGSERLLARSLSKELHRRHDYGH